MVKPFTVPPALTKLLAADAVARKAFDALAPGQQRDYSEWIAAAKRDETRERRLISAKQLLRQGAKIPTSGGNTVSTAPTAKKLGLKPGQTLVLLGQRPAVDLGALPEGTKLATSGKGDVVLAFAQDSKALARVAPKAFAAAARQTWLGFPKKTSGIATDLSRDEGWSAVLDAGWDTMSLISLDAAWSAFRVAPK